MSSHRSRSAALAGVLLVLASCVTTETVQPADESVLVTLESLGEFGLELPEDYARHEKRTRQRVTGGTILLEYEYRSPDGGPPYIHSSVEVYTSPGDACFSYSAGNIGLRMSSLEMTDRNDLFTYGEKSRFALIDKQGTPVGNVFAMCRSRTAMLLMFIGLYFDDAEEWRALIEPRLEALEAYEAANAAE